jgi:hypothetical protein
MADLRRDRGRGAGVLDGPERGQRRQLAAAQPGITLADPYVSIVWGVVVFGEPIRSGGGLAAAAVCAALMSASVLVLAQSPATKDDQAARERPGRRQAAVGQLPARRTEIAQSTWPG